jgi:hypothetical protein
VTPNGNLPALLVFLLTPRFMRARAVMSLLVLAIASIAANTRAEEALPSARKGPYAELFATAFVGDGLRFNNPYRLATPLGSSAESISRTAAYGDIGAAATLGDPFGFRHGLALRLSFAVEGVKQGVLTPAYLLWRRWRAFGAYGRAGVPIVLSPDVTWGLEAAAGGVWFVRGGIGIASEVVGDLFYGAGTREVQTPAYPVLSAQLGVVVAYEVLP